MVQQFEQQFGPQFRLLYKMELRFMRTVCQPTKQQYEKIAADGEPALKATMAKFAKTWRRPGTDEQSDPRTPITDIRVDKVFIGSCTNSRIEDLRVAAAVVKGRRVAGNIKQALVVPGSGLVKEQAEREGLDRIFRDAGFEWREPGCSMCVGMNGDLAHAGQRVASTSNRNFEGRQGQGARTHLLSPAMAAAAAVTGRLTDVRPLLAGA